MLHAIIPLNPLAYLETCRCVKYFNALDNSLSSGLAVSTGFSLQTRVHSSVIGESPDPLVTMMAKHVKSISSFGGLWRCEPDTPEALHTILW
jgi:hypothetical protein